MKRYFFDVNVKACVAYDYTGRYLPSLQQAHEFAELIAMDLGCTQVDGSYRMEVQVREAAGRHLLSVPVPPLDALAA